MKARNLFTGFLLFIVIACIKTGPSRTDKSLQPATQNTFTAPTDVKYSAEQLDNTSGLSNSSVNCIFQDSQNLLWIGTWDGLNRYDGTSFKKFRPQPDKNSLSNQVILKVGEDRAGKIWILTLHGINCYNKETDSFRHFYFNSENKPPVSESQFNMAFDADKNVYCAVQDWGMGYYDGVKFKRFSVNGLPAKTVRKFEFQDAGRLLVLYDDGALYSASVKSAAKGKKVISGISEISSGVRTFDAMPNKQVYIVSEGGHTYILSHDGKKNAQPLHNISGIAGHVPQGWVVWGKTGYSITNGKGTNIVEPWLKYLQNHKITSVIQGNEDIVWAGTDGDGVIKIYPQKKSFNLISRSQIPELDGGIVRSFLKDSGNAFWLGTKGRGLFKLPANFYLYPDKATLYTHFDEGNSGINNSVFALRKGKNGLVYIGTDGEGIAIYDNETSRLVKWEDIKGSETCGYFRSVYSIYQDNTGRLWLGTNGYGMISFNIEKADGNIILTHFFKYTAGSNTKNAISSNIIFSIIPKNDNQLWIGTRLGGLNLFDKKTGRFQSYKNIPGDTQSLSNNDILSLATDHKNRLWIGTSYGLNVLKEVSAGKAIFKSFTEKEGLPNNTIHGIVPAKNGLWISTNFGLSNFDVEALKFSNYSRSEGLQNNEFADGAYYSDAGSGYIFMGGIKGFNYFVPDNIKESSAVPDLLIDEISGQNQSLPYYQGLVISPNSSTYPSLTLKHDQNFFDIHLRALTYTNPEKSQYAYKLEGFDKDWNNIGNRQIISFTNVPKGKYSLRLKWSNSEGVWSNPVHALNIAIKPVWWQSNLALVLYAALAVVFILFVRSYNLKQRSLQQNILIRKKEEELHENRLSFFTNIAHEFLTPLTLIVGPAQKLSETAQAEGKNLKFIHMIQRNASRLLFLTQQLLEFRKAEYDYLENTVRNFDLVSLLEQIAELFDDWALDKNITYKLDIPPALPGWYDKDKLEKIIFNLMSNAFKYTPANGEIQLQCSVEGKDLSTLNITIKNSGKGIPKEKLDSLFDRFFLSDVKEKSDTEMFRTGIGLAYVKRLVTVLRGEIQVHSAANAETVFTVLIPCSKNAFSEKEIDTDTVPVLISQHLKNILEETPEKAVEVPDKISALNALEDSRKKILVVEDENEIHAYLKDLLSGKYIITEAYNGAEALKILDSEQPDVIISDVMMPVMDGVELCKKVKANINTCHIPFIMLTAKNSVIHRIEGLESGADSYIPKPFYPEHLLVRIQKLIEQKELIMKHFSQDTLVDNLSAIPVDNDQKTFIKSVIDIVRSNIDNENLDSAYLEKELGFSTSQLYRKVKETFSLSPGDLIRTIRLKHAAVLLRKNQLTVSEVCYKSGFNNRSYFYREFKKVYNTTPKNYQLLYKSKTIH